MSASIAGPFALDGKVVVVTGATGLLGQHHCAALAQAGARVVAVDLAEPALQALSERIAEGSGRPVLGMACDVTDKGALGALLRRVLDEFDSLDALVNNAALNEKVEDGEPLAARRFEDYPLAAWERAFSVNVTGTFLCCQILGGEMARRGRGSIVNVASTYALVAPDQSLYREPGEPQSFFKSAAYPATKGAVLSLTRYLAAYWGGNRVRVNALCPGGVENGQPRSFVERYAQRTPLGRMAIPSEYGGALVFLASDASSYMTGASLVVDGGFTAW